MMPQNLSKTCKELRQLVGKIYKSWSTSSRPCLSQLITIVLTVETSRKKSAPDEIPLNLRAFVASEGEAEPEPGDERSLTFSRQRDTSHFACVNRLPETRVVDASSLCFRLKSGKQVANQNFFLASLSA